MSLSIPNRKRALSESLPALRRSSTSSSHLGPAHHEAEFTSKQRLAQLPSFSLLGALEFRQVINSLQHDSTANALDVFETYTPYAGNHYLFHGYHSSRPHSPTSLAPLDEENNPFEESLSVPLHHRQDSGSLRAKAPSIVISTPGGEGSTISLPREDPPTRVQRLRFIARKVFQTIFPTLHEFKSKSWAGMIVSVFATPAVLALTLTLPVVIFAPDESEFTEGKSHHEERLLDFEEEGTERALTAEAAGAIEQLDVSWNKWLMAAQCIFGPLFCASVLFSESTFCLWSSFAHLHSPHYTLHPYHDRDCHSWNRRCGAGRDLCRLW
jgi:sodium/potassium/calcium exchanger 6